MPDNDVALAHTLVLGQGFIAHHFLFKGERKMELSDIRQFESDSSRGKVRIRVIDLENGLLLMITDSEKYKLGLSAVAIPPGQGRAEPTSTGLFSAGLDSTHVRTLAERVSSWIGQTCMIVVSVGPLDQAFMLELLTILKNYLLS